MVKIYQLFVRLPLKNERVFKLFKHFFFEGSKTEIEQQIGNAVPVNLAKFIASIIKEIIENGVPKQTTPSILFEMDKMPVFA